MKQLEFKGTKGEWDVRDDFRKPSILNESNQVLAMLSINCFDDEDGLHKYYSHNKMIANAKLIAAAPELLKALQETDKDLCVLWGQMLDLEKTNPIAEGLSNLIQNWRDRNKQAINKALK